MDTGIVMKTAFAGDIFFALLRHFLGGYPLWVNVFSNPTNEPLNLVLSQPNPGDIIRLDLTKSALCLQPGVHLGHTPQIQMGIHWAGFSSWLAGKGLFVLKVSGRGLVFIGSQGGLTQHQTYKRFAVEHHHLVAYSSKIRLKVDFPKRIIGSPIAGEGIVTQLIGGGIIYLQSRSRSGLVRYLNSRQG